jgi:hypothetical protein
VAWPVAADAREWESLPSSGWSYDRKEVKTELKDGVVNTENTMVFQLYSENPPGTKPAKTAEPTAQLYIGCETRTYKLWDIASSTQQGPMSTAMFDVAQTLEGYCDRIGKMPEKEPRPPG